MSDWSANQVIQGRYRLDSLLGKGGMGSVWRAEHLQLKSMVAVKRLDESIAQNPDAMARFIREAQASAALRSPNVVQVFDYGIDEGVAFLTMELLQGESLADRLHRLGRLSPAEALGFLNEVLRAIGKAHVAGIVHRDLKPDNIFICADEPEFAKVLDFGIAKLTGSGSLGHSKTQTGVVIGTPYYMSPEQAQGKVIDARSDLWSLGVIAYECLTGRLPFFGESFGEILVTICTEQATPPSQVAPVPSGFNEWFAKATQKDRELRFQSAKEMASSLSALLSSGPAMSTGWNVGNEAQHPGTLQVSAALSTEQRTATANSVVATTETRKNRGTLGLIIGFAVALVASGGGVVFLMRSSNPGDSNSVVAASAPLPSLVSTPSHPASPNRVVESVAVTDPRDVPVRPVEVSPLNSVASVNSADPVPSAARPAARVRRATSVGNSQTPVPKGDTPVEPHRAITRSLDL